MKGATGCQAVRISADDAETRKRSFQAYARKFYTLFLRMLGDQGSRGDAETLTGEVLAEISRSGVYQQPSSAVRICVFAFHYVLSYLRIRPETFPEKKPPQVQLQREGRVPPIKPNALERAIAQLPIGRRIVFVLHDVEGHKHNEIARLLGISASMSRATLHAARMEVREFLLR